MKMRKLIPLFAFLIYFGANAQGIQTLSLEEAIKYGKENRISLKNAKKDIEIADSKVKETTSIGLPQVNAEIDLRNNLRIATSAFQDFISPAIYGVLFAENVIPEKQLGAPGIFPAKFGTQYNGSAAVSVSQLLFNGSYFVGLQAAKTYKQLIQDQYNVSETDAVENIKKAYYSALVSLEKSKLIEINIERLTEFKRQTEALYAQGFVEKLDVNRLSVNLNNLIVEKDNVKRMTNFSLDLLKYQIGMPIQNQIVLIDSLKGFLNDGKSELTVNYANVPSIKALNTAIEINKLNVKNNKAAYLPVLSAYGSFGANSFSNQFSDLTNFNDNWYKNAVVGVNMKIPVFDSFMKKHKTQQAVLEQQKNENTLKDMMLGFELNHSQAMAQFKNAKSALESQKENMKLAEEIRHAVNVKYKNGLSSGLELIDSETSYKEALNHYTSAIYDLLIAKVDLEKASGNLNTKE